VSALYRLIEKLLARFSDRLICVSEATMTDLVNLRIAPRDRFAVIRLGLELHHFLTPDPKEVTKVRGELGAAPSTVLVTFVGRLVAIKRVDLLLAAVAAVRDSAPFLRLAIVGDGPLRSELEGRARALNVADIVHFSGFRTDIACVIAASNIAALTSDNEGTPVSLIEAGAGARCAVATAVGGVPEVIKPETGRLVPRGDVGAVAAALAELAFDAQLRDQLGAAARQHVLARWSVPRLIREASDLYDGLVRERHDSYA